jgi:hypothetical protein
MPLANTSVTLAGQPSKVGGTVARVFGWIVLAGGWTLAAALAGLILLLGGEGAAAVVGGPIALIASIVAYALLRSGRDLKKSGDDAEAATKNQAIFALANTRGGVLKAWDVGQMLQLTPKEGDDILTKLAKEYPDHVTVDVDDDGNVLYRFPAIHWGGLPNMAPNAPSPHVRVAEVSTRVAPVTPSEPLEDELVDAGEPARRKAR